MNNWTPDPTGHTRRDADELRAAGVDPATRQPREQVVACWCHAPTWHLTATCDRHYRTPVLDGSDPHPPPFYALRAYVEAAS